jgi:alpha-ketoglutarate-dependent 2,4-dichlorophenoxyacetate dioxygenase
MKARLEGLRAHHSIAYSRQTLGFEFSEDEQGLLKGAVHPLVRTLPRTGAGRSISRRSCETVFLAGPFPTAVCCLRDLTEHATQRQFVYRHAWNVGDLVIWTTAARCIARRRSTTAATGGSLRRVTTLDIERSRAVARARKVESGRV